MNDSSTRSANQCVVVDVGPKLDFQSARDFRTRCEELTDDGKRDLILDLSVTGILDSTGLGAIFALHRRARSSQRRVLLLKPSASASMVIKLTRCDRILKVCDTLDEAFGEMN